MHALLRPITLLALLFAAGCSDHASKLSETDTAGSGDTAEADGSADSGDGAGDAEGSSGMGLPYEPETTWPFALRPLQASEDRRIIDDRGRDTLIRGVNITSLGEYWQGVAGSPPTIETTDADWDEMAASGISVIRLVVHWSQLEPVRGEVSEAYLDRIDGYVRKAASRGIYTVIDMHQDAYSAFIFTPEGEVCPEGSSPAKGWDGAPAWAVFTDGASTCITGDRNSSPAVRNAWNAFYDNREGIRDRFIATWSAVATRFAGRPEVAGYDVINEPEVSRPAALLGPLYNSLLHDAVAAIRAAESGAPFEHLIMVEPAIPAGDPSFGIVVPSRSAIGAEVTNIVSAPHNYAESISVGAVGLTIELMNQFYLNAAKTLRVPTWIGEYGFWDTSESTVAKVGRYAADEDRRLLNGAWWQWRQPCGDPHSVGPVGDYEVIHLHGLACPGDRDLGPTEPFMRALRRGYVRSAPGRIRTLTNDLATGATTVEGENDGMAGELIVWTPTSDATHAVTTEGLDTVRTFAVGSGRILVARVTAPAGYRLEVAQR